MGWEKAMAMSFIKSIAATLAIAVIRQLLGDQAANCALLILSWSVLYCHDMERMRRTKPGKRLRNRHRKRSPSQDHK